LQNTSQISYTNLRHSTALKGVEPFSIEGCRIPWSDKKAPPLFRGIRAHLNKIKISFMVLFDTQLNETSRLAQNTLAPIAYKYKNMLRIHTGFRERTVANLFKNLLKANMCSLDDLLPYFDITLMNLRKGASKETWKHQKRRNTHLPETIIRNNCPVAL
jgi:hypothetical protein